MIRGKRLAVDSGDDITLLETSRLRWATRHDFGNCRLGREARQLEPTTLTVLTALTVVGERRLGIGRCLTTLTVLTALAAERDTTPAAKRPEAALADAQIDATVDVGQGGR